MITPVLLSLLVASTQSLDNHFVSQEEVPASEVHGVPPGQQRMSFKPPQLSDEEEMSLHMPAYLACDACVAVSNQLIGGFMNAHRHTALEKDLPEADVIEALEDVCTYQTFSAYGLTEHNGRHRLRGPGLDPSMNEGGISHMGGKWPARLATMCLETVGVFEDEVMELYTKWKLSEKKDLTDFLCLNTNIETFSKCVQVPEQPDLVRHDIEDMMKRQAEKDSSDTNEDTTDEESDSKSVQEKDMEKDEL